MKTKPPGKRCIAAAEKLAAVFERMAAYARANAGGTFDWAWWDKQTDDMSELMSKTWPTMADEPAFQKRRREMEAEQSRAVFFSFDTPQDFAAFMERMGFNPFEADAPKGKLN